jgi:hypothetical protein
MCAAALQGKIHVFHGSWCSLCPVVREMSGRQAFRGSLSGLALPAAAGYGIGGNPSRQAGQGECKIGPSGLYSDGFIPTWGRCDISAHVRQCTVGPKPTSYTAPM